jgi:WD40-like Beta Propeller Repeat
VGASETRLAVERRDPQTNKVGIWTLELSTGILSLATSHAADSVNPVLSPDGREFAFTSLRNGVFTMYRKVLGGGDEEVLIESNDMPIAQQWLADGSNNGGCQPRWRKDGKELFYLSLEGKLMSVPLNSAARLETTVPKPVFQTILRVNALEKKYWVTGNGNRFIFLEPPEDSTKPFTVVLNWTAGLRH